MVDDGDDGGDGDDGDGGDIMTIYVSDDNEKG